MIWEIIISIILIFSSIFQDQLRKLKIPSPGDWIFKYEDEKWAKILITLSRMFLFCLGIVILIHALFFSK